MVPSNTPQCLSQGKKSKSLTLLPTGAEGEAGRSLRLVTDLLWRAESADGDVRGELASDPAKREKQRKPSWGSKKDI